jgi:NAD(P)-dependent dehydrogenase (short-subunit alcohol dehydrogenase family)
MTGPLAGQIVVVAGGTGRVGGASVRALLAAGASLVLIGRSQAKLDALAAREIAAHVAPERIAMCVADLTQPEDGERVTRTALARFGRIDAVANLAGESATMPLVHSTLADLEANVRGHLVTTYNLTMPALRAMLEQPYADDARSRGRFVTITAGSSKDPAPRRGLFGAAKAAVNVLMLAIAREHKADGIVANAIVLGGVATEAAREYLNADEFAAAASPQEVADAVVFFTSDACSGINGTLTDLNARETD